MGQVIPLPGIKIKRNPARDLKPTDWRLGLYRKYNAMSKATLLEELVRFKNSYVGTVKDPTLLKKGEILLNVVSIRSTTPELQEAVSRLKMELFN